MKNLLAFIHPLSRVQKVLVSLYICAIIYAMSSGGSISLQAHYSYLADAYVHGRLYIQNPGKLHELLYYNYHYYSVFPPMPAILLIPFVFLGNFYWQFVLSILLSSVNIVLVYFVILRFLKSQTSAFWGSLLYGFGTIQWYHGSDGSSWYTAHIVALFFLWLALLEGFTKKRFFIIGLLLGAAYLSRLPTIFATFFFVSYFFKDFLKHPKSLLWLGMGLLPAIAANMLYNYLRFGVVYDIAYNLLPIHHEAWYQYGLISPMYIPIHLREMFTALPVITVNPPYITPSLFAMAIWFTTPAFIFVLFAPLRNKVAIASIIGLLMVALPSLMHGGNGFTQFGYRHTLDYMPFLLLLTVLGMKNNITLGKKLIIILSIIVNFWGIVMINFLRIYA